MVRGLVIQLAHKRLDDADGTVPKAEVLDEVTTVLEEIERQLQRRFDTE